MAPERDDDTRRLDRCLELFAAYQERLAAFVSALVPSPADADEVLQETNVTVWQRFEQFDPDGAESDFFAWASRIALNHVRNHSRRKSRSVLVFSTDMVEQLAARWDELGEDWEARRKALRSCLGKLPGEDRQLLERCYAPGVRVSEVAAESDRTSTSIYRSLRRIRRLLEQCIRRETLPRLGDA